VRLALTTKKKRRPGTVGRRGSPAWRLAVRPGRQFELGHLAGLYQTKEKMFSPSIFLRDRCLVVDREFRVSGNAALSKSFLAENTDSLRSGVENVRQVADQRPIFRLLRLPCPRNVEPRQVKCWQQKALARTSSPMGRRVAVRVCPSPPLSFSWAFPRPRN